MHARDEHRYAGDVASGVSSGAFSSASRLAFSSSRSRSTRRCTRTARVTLESRYIWEVYHAEGIDREVYWQMLGERDEADTFQCLAWIYDGVEFPYPALASGGRSASSA